MTDDKKFPVVEIFGPTLQGEGADIGSPCYFVRFGGCDFRCGQLPDGTWRSDGWVCDSLFAVLPEHVREAEKLTTSEIVNRLNQLVAGPRWVVFSGGNPALHELAPLVGELHKQKMRVAIETQGTVWKPWIADCDLVTVSPKPPSSYQKYAAGQLEDFLRKLDEAGTRTVVKTVIWDREDLVWTSWLRSYLHTMSPFYLSVCNDWQKPDVVADLLGRLRWIQETIVSDFPELGAVPILPQLHVLLWGNARGR